MIQEIVEQMAETNCKVFDKHRHAVRDAHAKSHGFLKGILKVPENLPEHLRQGLFAHPAIMMLWCVFLLPREICVAIRFRHLMALLLKF